MPINCAYCDAEFDDYATQDGWACCSDNCAYMLGDKVNGTETVGNATITPHYFERVFGSWFDAIKQKLLSGNKVEAIKLMRQCTGMGLLESKNAIEAYMESDPNIRLHCAIRSLTESLTSNSAVSGVYADKKALRTVLDFVNSDLIRKVESANVDDIPF